MEKLQLEDRERKKVGRDMVGKSAGKHNKERHGILGGGCLTCMVSAPRLRANFSASSIRRFPMPRLRWSGSTTSIPNDPVVGFSSSNLDWTQPNTTLEVPALANTISPFLMRSETSSAHVLWNVASFQSPSSETRYTRLIRSVKPCTSGRLSDVASSNVTSSCAIFYPKLIPKAILSGGEPKKCRGAKAGGGSWPLP